MRIKRFQTSIADETVIGGVIIPSASKAQPPTTAGTNSHLALRRTSENKENIPPSPLLSARSVITTYLSVVCRVSVQKIRDMPPKNQIVLIAFDPINEVNTYSGDVPISP